nr:immunoglobulin light chain junction region [Macaca mulatta]
CQVDDSSAKMLF